jgi:hypothetical protein
MLRTVIAQVRQAVLAGRHQVEGGTCGTARLIICNDHARLAAILYEPPIIRCEERFAERVDAARHPVWTPIWLPPARLECATFAFYSAAARGSAFHAPAGGCFSPRFSRNVFPA